MELFVPRVLIIIKVTTSLSCFAALSEAWRGDCLAVEAHDTDDPLDQPSSLRLDRSTLLAPPPGDAQLSKLDVLNKYINAPEHSLENLLAPPTRDIVWSRLPVASDVPTNTSDQLGPLPTTC